MKTFAKHEFMPVGQGLFAVGALGRSNDRAPQFRWVYDCGTLSESTLIKNALGRLEAGFAKRSKGKPSLDLVTISHFDTDHLSGLADLLTQFRVETLMLPFTHLAQRLQYMFSQRPYMDKADRAYYIDPIGTILSRVDVDIGQILLVLPSTGEPVPDQRFVSGPRRELDNEPRDESEGILFEEGDVDDAEDRAELDAMLASAASRNIPLRLIKSNSSATYLGLWEFVPYNEPRSRSKVSVDFLRKVEAKRLDLLSSQSLLGRNAAISDLKKIYDKHFGNTPKNRNVISLFLYSGPIGKSLHRLQIGVKSLKEMNLYCMWGCHYCWSARFKPTLFLKSGVTGGVLYTGDGYVDNQSRWQDLLRHFGHKRLVSLAALQVMHHGASSNWFPGLADLIKPKVSVFSSDPTRGTRLNKTGKISIPGKTRKKSHKSHPHIAVLKDFSPYYPLQADKQKGVQILSTYR